MHYLTVPGGYKSEIKVQVWVSSEALIKNLLLGSLLGSGAWLAALVVLWKVRCITMMSAYIFTSHTPCVSKIHSFYKNTVMLDWGPILLQRSFILVTTAETVFPNEVTFSSTEG